jgi:hypothetical protein
MLEIGAEGLDLESEQNFAFAFVTKKATEHFKTISAQIGSILKREWVT